MAPDVDSPEVENARCAFNSAGDGELAQQDTGQAVERRLWRVSCRNQNSQRERSTRESKT